MKNRPEKKYPAKVMITGGLTALGILPNPPTNVGKYWRILIDKRFHKTKVGRPKSNPLGRPKKIRGKRYGKGTMDTKTYRTWMKDVTDDLRKLYDKQPLSVKMYFDRARTTKKLGNQPGFDLFQDGASMHTGQLEYMKNLFGGSHVLSELLDIVKEDDINPAETLWAGLDTKLRPIKYFKGIPSLMRSLNRAVRGSFDGRACRRLLAKVPFALKSILKIKGQKLPQNWETHPKLGLPSWFDQLIANIEGAVFSGAVDTEYDSKWIEKKNREAIN